MEKHLVWARGWWKVLVKGQSGLRGLREPVTVQTRTQHFNNTPEQTPGEWGQALLIKVNINNKQFTQTANRSVGSKVRLGCSDITCVFVTQTVERWFGSAEPPKCKESKFFVGSFRGAGGLIQIQAEQEIRNPAFQQWAPLISHTKMFFRFFHFFFTLNHQRVITSYLRRRQVA